MVSESFKTAIKAVCTAAIATIISNKWNMWKRDISLDAFMDYIGD
jgi:hypothetical protein